MISLKKSLLPAVTAIGIGLGSMTPANAQQTAYAIANGGTTLVRFDTATPGTVTTVGNFSGGNTFLDAIDFRPATGQLYGYLSSSNSFYTVNLATGALTAAPAVTGAATNTNQLGIDFNPTIDRVRIVTDSAQNLVYNPNNGVTTVATNLFYAPGDVNLTPGAAPLVVENAYTNNIAGFFGTSTQYGIDYGVDALVTIANNAGTLNTVGSLGVDTDAFTGFDIFTGTNGVNSAFALLNGDTTQGFYSINLATGAATLRGNLGGGLSQIYSLAIVPTVVPEPGSVALGCVSVLMGAGVFLKRRKK